MSVSATGPSPAKICVLCHEDCSARPRIRDPQGHYVCKTCADARARPAPAPAPSPESPVAADGIDVAGLQEYALAPEEPVAPTLAPLPAPPPSDHPHKPKKKTGAKKPALAQSTYVCRNCGYDMRGLKEPTCPECGEVTRPSTKSDYLLEIERETVRRAYLRPVIWLGVGLVLAAIFLLIKGAPMIHWAFVYALWLVSIPFCLMCLYAARIFDVQTDGPWYLDLLCMAAVVAMTSAVSYLVQDLPSLMVYLAVVGGTWVVMCIHLLDLDTWEAIVVGLVSFVARMFIYFGLFFAFGL